MVFAKVLYDTLRIMQEEIYKQVFSHFCSYPGYGLILCAPVDFCNEPLVIFALLLGDSGQEHSHQGKKKNMLFSQCTNYYYAKTICHAPPIYDQVGYIIHHTWVRADLDG